MDEYYAETLAARRLKRCYDIAPPRVQQYLESEIQYVLNHVENNHYVLELGCGYGRVLQPLSKKASRVVGIDTSFSSLVLAEELIGIDSRIELVLGDAAQTGFATHAFDVVVCIQNGISAFKRDPKELVRESMRITRSGGVCLFSSYSEKFWPDRLDWFTQQAAEGLLGEIDLNKTGSGRIVCKDGFTASTYSPIDFETLCRKLDVVSDIVEIDESSIFSRIHVR